MTTLSFCKSLPAALLGLVLIGSAAEATPITVPSSLATGDQYRLVFATSIFTSATSSDINDYNTFVDNLANAVPKLAALGTTWKAIVSTPNVDARDNTATNPTVSTGVPIFTLNGTSEIASDYADLWDGVIAASINRDETGAAGGGFVWTGSQFDGTGNSELGNASGYATVGGNMLSQWTSYFVHPLDSNYPLYAISGLLTVPKATSSDPVPEPGTLGLLGAGLALAFVSKQRPRKA